MTLEEFSAANRRRSESPDGFGHNMADWSLSDWMVAVMGELGEAANVLKKLNRVRDGIIGNSETSEDLRQSLKDEVADTFIYLDLFAQAAGFSLEEVVRAKFNKTSERIGYPQVLL
jgi:NTP pyrophosphatase (non-canonical NTP hydrolase)